MPKSDLPFGSEFSPQQVDLRTLLEMAREHGGNWQAFEAAIRVEYFEGHRTTERNRAKLANNTRLSMIAYGLVERDAQLTPVGEALYLVRVDTGALHNAFARHILLQLHGMTLVQCVRDIQAAGERVNLIRLREWLDERGIHFPRGGRHPSTMHLWLRSAGVFGAGWRVDEARLEEALGASADAFDALSALTREQACYLRAIANIGDAGPHAANEVEALASATYGVKFNEKSLPKDVLYPLRDAGYISLERTTGGRGAKPSLVRPTEKVRSEIVEPLLRQIEAQVNSDLRPYLRQSLAEILERMDSRDKHVKGLALEALALKLMRLLDMDYVATRLRGAQTGGAEVDLVFESSRLVFSRWQVHGADVERFTLDDLAVQVGLVHISRADTLLVLCTGAIAAEAREYAAMLTRDAQLTALLLDGRAVRDLCAEPTLLSQIVADETTAMHQSTLDGAQGVVVRGTSALSL